LLVRAGSGLAGPVASTSAGVPEGTLGHTIVIPLDDDAAIDEAFDRHGHDLAAAIVELVPANYGLLLPRAEWVAHLADRCRAAGALLVADEVITGFRSGLTGASGVFGLEPDLVCYGKIIGGGFPVGAYGGRADLMNLVAPAGPVYQAGTLSANPIGMRAGLATLSAMVERDGWATLERRTNAFTDDLAARLAHVAPDIDVVRHASIFWLRKRTGEPVRRPDQIPQDNAEWFARFFHALLARGVYFPPSSYEVGFLSLAHDDTTLKLAADAIVDAAGHVRQ
jgi:glutamate-1-semialdehyde 2,1-aminomutase